MVAPLELLAPQDEVPQDEAPQEKAPRDKAPQMLKDKLRPLDIIICQMEL